MKNLYVNSLYSPKRRETIPVRVGTIIIGGGNPVVVQSMTTTNSNDVDATVAQVLDLWRAGCELVRITIPTVKEARALESIMHGVRSAGCTVPVSADIHFQPKAAYEAVKWVDKVRINPGNFVDKGIGSLRDFSDEEFSHGRELAREALIPLLDAAKARGVALRIGVNHGSLSARMIHKYGDTVEGMVESALEYIKLCEEQNFDQIVVSLKASNTKVVITAYRLLIVRLRQEGLKEYPLHVGVTEAGEGEDGRTKSALGIGALLLDGLGDTIRVSLTESPVNEIPVAQNVIKACSLSPVSFEGAEWEHDHYHYQRRVATEVMVGTKKIGTGNPVIVGTEIPVGSSGVTRPAEFSVQADIAKEQAVYGLAELSSSIQTAGKNRVWSYRGSENYVTAYRAIAAYLGQIKCNDPIILRLPEYKTEIEKLRIIAEIGSLLVDGIGDALVVETNRQSDIETAFDILQAAGMRRTKTEFISCPGCGRTLFELEETNKRVKAKTGHLKDVAIAVMGCIVNGPGEMADADFGYVGAGPGKINLYVGQQVVKKGIATDTAVDELIALIKEQGRWIEP